MLLIVTWTKPLHHQEFLQRNPQLLFPIISSCKVYWDDLSTEALFEGKQPLELAGQMEALLYALLRASSVGYIPHCLESSSDFTPLQNVGIYMKAFGLEENPLEAFRPLDITSIVKSLRERLVGAWHCKSSSLSIRQCGILELLG